jgi:hypothetical protein
MPDYSKWNIKKLRTLLVELQTGGLRARDMQIVLHIENLILEKQK